MRSLPHNPHCTNFPANFSVDKYDKEKKFFFNAEPASGVSRTSTEPGRHLVFIWDMTVSILKGLDSNTCGAGEPVPISLWEPPHPSPAGLLQHQGPPFVNTLIWVRWSLPTSALLPLETLVQKPWVRRRGLFSGFSGNLGMKAEV